MPRDHPSITPEMIAAGADVLEGVGEIGRWLAESLAASVLERAFETMRGTSVGLMPTHGGCVPMHGDWACGYPIPCGQHGCCATRCRTA